MVINHTSVTAVPMTSDRIAAKRLQTLRALGSLPDSRIISQMPIA